VELAPINIVTFWVLAKTLATYEVTSPRASSGTIITSKQGERFQGDNVRPEYLGRFVIEVQVEHELQPEASNSK
jgi:hypothetical protein